MPQQSAIDVELSVIVPMFNEGETCDVFFDHTLPILNGITASFEIVCVDDGSTDTTARRVEHWAKRDPRVKLISFTRNFGKEAALTAGLEFARGQAIVPLDADLQDPPELIAEMMERWRRGAPLVLARRIDRQSDTFLKRTTSTLFYLVFSRLAHPALPRDVGDFRLMDRAVVDALRQLSERSRFMKGLFAWVGYNAEIIEYVRPERRAGRTKFNYFRLWNFALDGVFSFSTLPIKIWSYIGLSLSTLAFVYIMVVIAQKLFFGIDVPGYASVVTIMLFFNGMILLSLGIIGEYISRIFLEVKQRPQYLVQHTIGIVADATAPVDVESLKRLAS